MSEVGKAPGSSSPGAPVPAAAAAALAQGAVGQSIGDEESIEGADAGGPTARDKLLRTVGQAVWEKVKAAQEERMRKFESTSFAVWPDVLAPLLPPANERSYKVTDIATLVYRDTAAQLQRSKIAIYTALVFDVITAQPYFESKERLNELSQRLADRLLPPGRILPSPAEVARVEAWVRKFAEALSTPNQMQKIRNTVRMNAMRSSAGRALLARYPIPELDAVGVGGVGVGVGVGVTGVVLSASGGGGGGGTVDVTHAGMALVSDEMLGVQKRKRGSRTSPKRSKAQVSVEFSPPPPASPPPASLISSSNGLNTSPRPPSARTQV